MGKAINNCPHCHKNDCIQDVVFLNCEMYGNEYFSLPCSHCNKMLDVTVRKVVIVDSIFKSNKKLCESDF